MGGWRQMQLASHPYFSLLHSKGCVILEGLKYQRVNECWQDTTTVPVVYHVLNVYCIQGTVLSALYKHLP